jgi:hypothetical protein
MNKFTLEQLAKHHDTTGSIVHEYVTLSDYEKLKAERDALIARIQVAERVEKLLGDAPELTFDDCLSLFSDDIRNIKVEYCRAGFIEGYEQCHHDIDNDYISRSEPMANEYAAKIRRGEIK